MNALLLLVLAQTATPLAKNVVLIVSDGVRAREIFEGADRSLMGEAGGVENEAGCVEKFWRADARARRETLMPFFWKKVAREGQVFGDGSRGSPMRVTNKARVSYPGYNELFTGAADHRIETNAWVDNPNVTVFEWLNAKPAFSGKVSAFATWATFARIFAVGRSKLEVHAGWTPPFEHDAERTPGKDLIDTLHRSTTPLFGGNALDALTYAALKESLKTKRPRVVFLGLGETDEWMHAGRYDLALEALSRADATIADLWDTMQAMPEYKDSTTFIITTDHGRGGLPWEWKHHGASVLGAEDIWLGAIGPGIPPLGVRSSTGLVTQSQVASTVAHVLGEDWRASNPRAGSTLPLWPLLVSGRPSLTLQRNAE
ncbi:MAG: alkaline phosphatase family protein [Myxococcales bacterium]|nr:alkaline phosphatase family protein [Myxococcales bacterium]